MLVLVYKLKYNDHDINELKNFPDFSHNLYTQTIEQPKQLVVVEVQQWDVGQEKLGILNLLEIPHFE